MSNALHFAETKNRPSGEAGFVCGANWLEGEPPAELELARGVDVLRDVPEAGAIAVRGGVAGLLRLYQSRAVDGRVSVLRVVGHVVTRDIEAQRFRFGELYRRINGEVQ